MPGKSRGSKGKHSRYSKKSRAVQRHSTMASPGPVATDTPAPAVITRTPSSSRMPASPSKSRVPQYPYIIREIRRIGILAGIIIAILVVLALIFS